MSSQHGASQDEPGATDRHLLARRDRRGRGVRGPIAWPPVPLMTTRADRFDEHVIEAATRVEERLGRAFPSVEFVVEQVPIHFTPWEQDEVPLGRLVPGAGQQVPRIVLYRRPIETRISTDAELALLVQEIVSEQVAALIGIDPDELDIG